MSLLTRVLRRDSILLYEEVMLEQLTFDVCLQSPYNLLYDFIHKLGIEENKNIRNTAWAFLNDSQLTIMCLRLKPADIAIASIYFAVSILLQKCSNFITKLYGEA